MAELEKQLDAEMGPLLLSSSPHINSPVSTRALMTNVLIALAPAAIFGVVLYGVPALLTILVSVASAVAAEALFRTIIGKDVRVRDLSAAVTGLLLALVIPPGAPLWMTALGAVFAVVVAKEFFGGLGANVFNPALIGRAFLLMSFPAAYTSWVIPKTFSRGILDGASSATPLGIVKQSLEGVTSATPRQGFSEALTELGAHFTASGLASSGDYGGVMQTLFLGNHGGCIGESSALLILLGGLYLLLTKTIDWRAPASMAAAALILSLALGMDPLFTLLGGGLLFGALFMATDYVSAPVTSTGKIVFGVGAGIITVLIRKWGNYPEGVSYGILIMNALTPFLNRLIQKKYGFVPKKKPAPKGAAK